MRKHMRHITSIRKTRTNLVHFIHYYLVSCWRKLPVQLDKRKQGIKIRKTCRILAVYRWEDLIPINFRDSVEKWWQQNNGMIGKFKIDMQISLNWMLFILNNLQERFLKWKVILFSLTSILDIFSILCWTSG